MLVGAISYVLYGIVFFIRSFVGNGFELGVETLNGVTVSQLNTLNPAIFYYIQHLHVATAEFIIATGIAVAALSWYGVRSGQLWAFVAAVIAPVVGIAVVIPMHWLNNFSHNWITHLGPIYLGTVIFVIGALIALKGFMVKSDVAISKGG